MFMYFGKTWIWDFIWILRFEIAIWGLDLGFGFALWYLGFENKRFEIFM